MYGSICSNVCIPVTAVCFLESMEITVLSLPVAGPAIPAVTVYPKRSQTSTTENDLKEEAVPSRKSSSSGVSGRGVTPPSPMLGNANNPNKADIPDRKKSSVVPTVSMQVYCVLLDYRFLF